MAAKEHHRKKMTNHISRAIEVALDSPAECWNERCADDGRFCVDGVGKRIIARDEALSQRSQTPRQVYNSKDLNSVVPHLLLIFIFLPHARSVCSGLDDCTIYGGWENFANNLGTDLAPLLALFGEQVTKQFMSESTSGLDSILFGLAPLGVITAIISAIRVSGSPRLRALVGRAKESRGQVEADLMSSTSPDVCELWNGDGVVRVLGRPVLLQIIRARDENGAYRLYTFQEAYDRIFGPADNGDYPVQSLGQNPPNLSLNVNMDPLPRYVSILLISIGVLLQGGVLVYAAVSQYHLKLSKYDGDVVIVYGFPLLATGTIFLAIGMYFCAEVVQTSTKERTWNFRKPGFHCEGIIWLQQGGQTVGDQRFESFARHMDKKHEIRTSVKCEKLRTTQIVLVSVGLTLVGFVSQFVALRAMHATVTVVQLGAILIMTAIRSCAHIQRNDKNDILDPLQVEGHELEWLAKDLHGCTAWEVQLGSFYVGEARDRRVPDSPSPMPDSVQMAPIDELDLGPVFTSEEVSIPGSPPLIPHSLPSISALLHAVHNPPSILDSPPAISDLIWIDKSEEDGSWPGLIEKAGEQTPAVLDSPAVTCNPPPIPDSHHSIPESPSTGALPLITDPVPAVSDSLSAIPASPPVVAVPPPLVVNSASAVLNSTRPISISSPPIPAAPPLGPVGRQNPGEPENLAIEVMQTRARLAELSQGWVLQLRKTVKSLQTTLDKTMNEIYTSITLKEDWKSKESYSWFLPVWAEQKGPLTNRSSRGPTMFVELTMTRGLDQNDHWGPWVSNPCELEAILSLWVSSAKEKRMHSNGSVSGSVGQASECFWYLGVGSDKASRDYNLWIHRETVPCKDKLSEGHMYFGSVDSLPADKDAPCLTVKSSNALEILCAQHIYSAFMSKLTPEIVSIGGTTERRRTEITTSEGNLPTWMHFRLNNTKLVRLAGIFFEARLGTIEEAYFCFFPFLSREEIVPLAKEAFREASQAAKRCQSSGGWDQALLIDEWMSDNKEATGFDELGLAIWYSEIDERVLVLLGFINNCIISREYDHPIWRSPGPFAKILRGVMRMSRGRDATSVLYWNTVVFYVLHLWQKFTSQRGLQFSKANKVEVIINKLNKKKRKAEVFKLAVEFLHSLPVSQDLPQQIQLLLLIRNLALRNDEITMANNISLVVWNATLSAGGTRELVSANYGASQILLSMRLSSSVFLNMEDLEKYLPNMAGFDNAGEGAITQVALNTSSIEVDLKLLRPYRTLLQGAAEAGRLDAVKRILECEPEAVNAAPISPYGRSALQAASGNGHHELVEYLLTCASPRSDVNCPAAVPFGCTALQAASQGGHADVVKLLLANGASVDVVPVPNLDHCVQFRRRLNMDVSVEVTAYGYQYIPAHRVHQTRVGVSALCAAATNGHEKVVQTLLRAKAEVNMMSHGTALQAAAAAGHLRVVKKLRRWGANLNVAADACGGATALQAAVGEGHFYVARYLLDFGADVDAPPAAYHGRSALAAAAGRGDTFMVEYLIYKGADVNQAPGTCFGTTALQAAARIGNPQIVSILLKSGADINGPAATIGGITALAAAAAAGHLDIVKLLLNHPEPGDANAAAPYGGLTALQAAAEGGHAKIVELLLLKGADANDMPAPGGGKTALVAALEGGHVEVVNMLIGAGANVNEGLVDDFGHSAIEEAVGEGMLDVVEEWLATFKPLKRRGIIPLAVAVQSGNLDMVDMLLNAEANATMEEDEENQLMREEYGLDEDRVETMNRILGKPQYSDTIEKSASERLLFERKIATLLKMKNLLQNIKLEAQEFPIHLAERLGYVDIAKRLKSVPEEEMARKRGSEIVENGDSDDERSMVYI
ncbi:uncharacterized protein H6S33_004829 [Morchella sextelata]|uniref:uncharacterized protein n=1 Tax=Morchella sextelata TaxID=1174677 RepID=UPI001D059DB3|nr:uncharacterized protein H6S33_004829 [Morchella sextelata]KAH0605607.1 hypothetical protein H6S33_004829 [Morchella sextelata]